MPTTTEISDYVTGLSSATLTGAEEVYLATDEKATVQDIANFGGKVWKAQIDQTGTSAPTLTVLRDDFGLTVTTSYGLVGVYTLSGFTGLITGLVEIDITCPNSGTNTADAGGTPSTNVIAIITYSSGVPSNGVLTNNAGTSDFGSSVITLTKYD
jgi:hypothetical protein